MLTPYAISSYIQDHLKMDVSNDSHFIDRVIAHLNSQHLALDMKGLESAARAIGLQNSSFLTFFVTKGLHNDPPEFTLGQILPSALSRQDALEGLPELYQTYATWIQRPEHRMMASYLFAHVMTHDRLRAKHLHQAGIDWFELLNPAWHALPLGEKVSVSSKLSELYCSQKIKGHTEEPFIHDIIRHRNVNAGGVVDELVTLGNTYPELKGSCAAALFKYTGSTELAKSWWRHATPFEHDWLACACRVKYIEDYEPKYASDSYQYYTGLDEMAASLWPEAWTLFQAQYAIQASLYGTVPDANVFLFNPRFSHHAIPTALSLPELN